MNSPAVCQAVVGRLSQALDFEVSDILLEAFRIQSRLLTAARETHAQPGTVQRVTLKTYELPWEHEFELDVTVSGKHLMTVKAALRLDLEVTALVAVVQRGHLTDWKAAATVSWPPHRAGPRARFQREAFRAALRAEMRFRHSTDRRGKTPLGLSFKRLPEGIFAQKACLNELSPSHGSSVVWLDADGRL